MLQKTGVLSRVTIGKKLTTGVVFLLILVSSGIGIMSYRQAYRSVYDQLEETIQQMAGQGAMVIGKQLGCYLMAMELIACRNDIQTMDWEQQRPVLEQETRKLKFLGMGIVKPDGQAFYPDGSTASLGDRDYFQKAMKGETNYSGIIISRVTNTPVMIIATPIKGENGKPAAVLIARLDGNWLSGITDPLGYGKKGYAYIIDRNGT
ncbi:MAG: cache domain-containing protein, partial [Pseudomonadota bacterium]